MMKKIQIIIPMSGFGERFRKAGYTLPKPLIMLEEKPIIAHVIDLFPGETDFIFICNREHLENPDYRMKEILMHYCPTGQIIGIEPHHKGPVFAVSQVMDHIDPHRPCVVNYCDFTCYWDWQTFKRFAEETQCDGAIPAYKGFHPHSLGSTNYAYMRESNGFVLDIQEKKPYTDNRMQEYASSGTYYFASGALMREAFEAQMAQDLSLNGEYYVSLAYKPLLAAKRKICVYELQYFMQWGTPEDVSEYQQWSETFRRLISPDYLKHPHHAGTTLIPLGGLGSRFTNEGYSLPKPLIPISGKPMIVQATDDLPRSDRQIFVLRRDMSGSNTVVETLQARYKDMTTVWLDALTEGQACSAQIGVEKADVSAEKPLTIGACDNGALYKAEIFDSLMKDPTIDVIVWAARGYTNARRHPKMYGWIDCNEKGEISRVSVKQALEKPESDPIVIGTFTFKRAGDFLKAVKQMVARKGRINGEYYIDECINDAIMLELKCRIFVVDSFLCWGTPNDLRTFEYWQSCFHQWKSHPYRLENDSHVFQGKNE